MRQDKRNKLFLAVVVVLPWWCARVDQANFACRPGLRPCGLYFLFKSASSGLRPCGLIYICMSWWDWPLKMGYLIPTLHGTASHLFL